MNQESFLLELKKKLRRLPKDEIDNILLYYKEYFEDSGYYKYHEAYHLLRFPNERQILEDAYQQYIELKKAGLWGTRKYF